MRIAQKEVHDYFTGQDFYEFEKSGNSEYQILLVEGFLGDLMYTFIQGTDDDSFKHGILWLNGDRPEDPPDSLGIDRKTFTVTYVYEDTPARGMDLSIHPFVKEDGTYVAILHSLAGEIVRMFRSRDGVIRGHNVDKALGRHLEYLGSWFNISRFSGETDEGLRGRILEYLSSYVSSGTIESISTAVEAYTGTVPEITELWQSISYFDYNQDDYDNQLSPDQWRTYLFEGGAPDNVYTFQAYFYDELYSLNTFFCILPFEVMTEFGVDEIKTIIQIAKAAGVQGYLGWLVDEDFADTSLRLGGDITMTDGQKDIPLKTSIFGADWNVPESGNYAYQLNYTSLGASTTKGTIIIDNTVKLGAELWEDYMMIGYVNLVSTAHVDHKIGYVMRYQDSSNYYFIGFKTETTDGGVGDNKSTYEVYKVTSGSYSRIANHYDTGNNYSGGSELYYGLPNTVGTDGVLAEDTQYHFRVEVYGIVCRVYISNELVFENTTDFGDYTEGEIGLEAYTENNTDIVAYFDNIKVVS